MNMYCLDLVDNDGINPTETNALPRTPPTCCPDLFFILSPARHVFIEHPREQPAEIPLATRRSNQLLVRCGGAIERADAGGQTAGAVKRARVVDPDNK